MKKLFFMLLAATLLIACENNEIEPGGSSQDTFEGMAKTILFSASSPKLSATHGECLFKAPNGIIFKREFAYTQENGQSKVILDKGLKEGKYTLLAFRIDIIDDEKAVRSVSEAEEDGKESYGMGCTVSVSGDEVAVVSSYNEEMGMYGSGTASDPFIVSSYSHLLNLAELANDANTNGLLDSTYHYAQACDLDMDFASWKVADGYGWNSIGCSNLTPFRGRYNGKGYKISNLWSERDASAFVALFGCTQNARIDSLTIENANMEGFFCSAALVGCAMTRADFDDVTYISNCKVQNSTISGSDDNDPNRLAIGGLIGAVEQHARLFINHCEVASSNKIAGGYTVGGILGAGAVGSRTIITDCVNKADVSSYYAPCGGIVGSADSLFLVGCSNYGEIKANVGGTEGENATKIGAGGIIGGSGPAQVYSCINYGNISGQEGVAGIVGSARMTGNSETGEEYSYNDIVVYNCENRGDIQGVKSVGGINGESQCTIYGVQNSGAVNGESYVAGIIGQAPMCATHNTINKGSVNGTDYVGGIVGNCVMGSITSTQNFADISATGNYVGGIVGLSGTYFIAHYSTNTGIVASTMEDASVGGIAGEIGDPKNWTSDDTKNIITGSIGAIRATKGIINYYVSCSLAAAMNSFASRATTRSSSDEDRFVLSYNLTLARQGGITKENFSSITSGLLPFMNNDEYDAYIDGISSLNDQNIGTMQATLNLSRAEHEIYGGFSQYNQDLIDYSVAEATSDEYFQSVNDFLGERADEIAHVEKVEDFIHKAVGAAITIVSIATSIATGGAAAGTTAATVAKIIKYTCTLTKFANNISCSTTDFDQNTVILSQCVNQGTLKAENDCNIGGFVGVMHEYGMINKCLNLGGIEATEKSSYGQITTTAKNRCEIEECVLAGGKSWNGYDVDKKKSSADMEGVYYWADGEVSDNTSNHSTNILTKEDLANPDTYQGLSLGDNGNYWIMSQYGDLTLPVPYRCRFME